MPDADARFTRAVQAFEADAAALAERQAAAVLERFASYTDAAVPRASLVASGLRNVTQLVAILRSGALPGADELDEARRARERTAQGVPADDLYAAYRMCLRLLTEAFVAHGERLRVPRERLLDTMRLLWESADLLTSAVVVARLAAELDLARHDEGRRLDVLRALLFGGGTTVERRQRLAALGLPPDRSYYVLRARAATAAAREALRARLEASLRTYGCRPLLGIVDGDVAGIAPLRPPRDDRGYTAGIAGPGAVETLPQAFATATRLLGVALRFAGPGPHELGDLSLRVAVAADADLARLLDERYLEPLRGVGEFGVQVVETLDAYLAAGARIGEAATALGLHPNTVRHRLNRFTDLTGAALDDLEVLFELWWVLTWSRGETADQP
ncbi:MAG: PucR family transcriptional regulator [Gammaproteobacteria bacterium]